jgi:hypothetical protein
MPLTENSSNCAPLTARGKAASNTKLSADWQLSAALLSRPVDLRALVTLSGKNPSSFLETSVLHRLTSLLNNKNASVSNLDTKLSILQVFGNIAKAEDNREAIRGVIMAISEWFEEYMFENEGSYAIPPEIRMMDDVEEPYLHKAMLILICRAYDYQLKSEDLLELTNQDTILALACAIGVLEDGFTEETAIVKKRDAKAGQVAQWEQGTVYKQHEKSLVLQLCTMTRGFTNPATYFKQESGDEDVALHSIEEFRLKINQLLALALDAELVEKITEALCDCVFPDEYSSLKAMLGEDPTETGETSTSLSDQDHLAIISIQGFIHNLYLYANEVYLPLFRQHLLVESRVTPDLILPYLHSCLTQISETGMESGSHSESLVIQGITSSLKSLVLATFRAPTTSAAVQAFTLLNPSQTLVQSCWDVMKTDVTILPLVIFFNVNINSLDISNQDARNTLPESSKPESLLHAIAAVFCGLTAKSQQTVLRRLHRSSSMPVARDQASFPLVWGMLTSIYKADMNSECKQTLAEKVEPEGKAEPSLHAAGDDSWCPGKAVAADSPEKCRAPAKDCAPEQPSSSSSSRSESKDGAVNAAAPAAAAGGGGGAPARAEGKSAPPKVAAEKAFRLLGDLPGLVPSAADAAPKSKKEKMQGLVVQKREKKSRRGKGGKDKGEQSEGKEAEPEPAAKAPARVKYTPGAKVDEKDFNCAINGHVMKEPVRAPNGLVFEKATIEDWITRMGSVCPITGDVFGVSDLVLDKDIQNAIMAMQINKQMRAGMADPFACDNDDDDDDMYDF